MSTQTHGFLLYPQRVGSNKITIGVRIAENHLRDTLTLKQLQELQASNQSFVIHCDSNSNLVRITKTVRATSAMGAQRAARSLRRLLKKVGIEVTETPLPTPAAVNEALGLKEAA